MAVFVCILLNINCRNLNNTETQHLIKNNQTTQNKSPLCWIDFLSSLQFFSPEAVEHKTEDSNLWKKPTLSTKSKLHNHLCVLKTPKSAGMMVLLQ